jgi:hypothetical protein
MLEIPTKTREENTVTVQWGGIIFMLHRLRAVRPPPPSLSTSFENAFAEDHKTPQAKPKKKLLSPSANVQAHQRRHTSLGLVAFQRKIVERARSRAHARSGGFGLDLWRLFCHDGHLLVDNSGAA